MQSTTGTNYNDCMVQVGKWAYSNEGNQQAQTAYQTLYGIYLASQPGVAAASPSVRSSARTRSQRPSRARQRTGSATPTTTTTTATRTRVRTRTPPGQLGAVDAKVLTQIVANPNIAIEALRKRPSLRTMEPNILGTCIARLLKTGNMSGTPKVGPFTATQKGIDALNKQPTSIGAARQARSARGTKAANVAPTTEENVAAAG